MDILVKLSEKIDELLEKYEKLQRENNELKVEISNLKNLLEEKDLELLKCKEDMALKELEIEEILAKIENLQ